MQTSNKLINILIQLLLFSITESLKPENTLKNDNIHTSHVPKFIFFQNLFHQIIGYEQFLKNNQFVKFHN